MPTFTPVAFRVRCSGSLHRIRLTRRGKLCLLDHDAESCASEKALLALGGAPCRCFQILKAWRDCSAMPYHVVKGRAVIAGQNGLPKALRPQAQLTILRRHERSGYRMWTHEGGYAGLYNNDQQRLAAAHLALSTALQSSDYGGHLDKLIHVYDLASIASPRHSTLTGRAVSPLVRGGRMAAVDRKWSQMSLSARVHVPALLMAAHRLGTLRVYDGRRKLVTLTATVWDYYRDEYEGLVGRESVDSDGRPIVTERPAVLHRGVRRSKGERYEVWRVARWL